MENKVKITNPSIKNSMKVIRAAIKSKNSVKMESVNLGFGKNYVYDVRSRLNDRIKTNVITKSEAKEFNRLYKEYQTLNS